MRGNKILSRLLGFVFLAALLGSQSSCRTTNSLTPKTTSPSDNLPNVVLWAWERPENLEFVDPKEFGVAFLAQTLLLEGENVIFRPRRQPLRINPETKLVAVTRIETAKIHENSVVSNSKQKELAKAQ